MSYKKNEDGTYTFKSSRLSLYELSVLQKELDNHLDQLVGGKADALVAKLGKHAFNKKEIYREAFYSMFHEYLEGNLEVNDILL